MPQGKNPQLEVFRTKVRLLLDQYADKMRLFVAENRALGMTSEGIRKIRLDPKSKWAQEREKLIKNIKREAAGLINVIHLTAYKKGLL